MNQIVDAQHSEGLDDKYFVPSLAKGLALLECFSKNQSELTISQFAAMLQINRSSVFRLVFTLEQLGYIRKSANKTYRLNSKVMRLGFNALSNQSIIELSTPILKELRDRTTAACNLAILEGNELVYLNHIDAKGPFTATVKIGTRWPAHATVMGQLLLAALPVEEVKQRYKNFKDWKRYSEITPYDLNSLLHRLEHVRSQPAMISWGHFLTGVVVCAAPIYGQRDHERVAVIAISCPMDTYSRDYFETEMQQCVIDAANEISKLVY
jgi:DNA-binding IclR family transcriptional regulator